MRQPDGGRDRPASRRILRASAVENEDLFWGVRGGGGNFGIATSLEFRLHPVGPVVTGGALFFPAEKAGDLLRFYRDWVQDLPDELTTAVTLATATPAPFLPEELHEKRVAIVTGCYAGAPEDGLRAFRPLKELGSACADLVAPMPYTALQTFVDEMWRPGSHNYLKSGYLGGLKDDAIEMLLQAHQRVVSQDSQIELHHLGGAVGRLDENETAFGHRDAPYLLNVIARWTNPGESDQHVGWARELHASMTQFATGGVYVNFLGEEGPDRVKAAYGEGKYQRLVELKNKYDPTNFFRVNQNIPPDRQTAHVGVENRLRP
ncbi:MAG TPA: BBE domain-containing protein [Actinomycetota bacterium]|nr:BBE domain-containing protein [Actinomycetota bacterium]